MSKVAELVEQAFLAGYRHGVEGFSVWKDGQQFVGVMRTPLRDVLKRAPDDCRDAYSRWLQHQQVKHDGVEKPIVGLEADESTNVD